MMRVQAVSDNSTLCELTRFLFTSFQESERIQVEHILAKREQGFKDEISCFKQILAKDVKVLEKEVHVLVKQAKEGHVVKEVLENEVKELKKELSLAYIGKREVENKMERQFEMIESERETMEKNFKEELKKLRDFHKKEMEREAASVGKKLSCIALEKLILKEEVRKSRIEFEEKMKGYGDMVKELKEECGSMEKKLSLACIEKCEVEDKMQRQCEMFEDERETMQKNFKEELKKLRDFHKKEMEREAASVEKKLSCIALEKLILKEEVRKSRIEFEEKMKEHCEMVKEVKEERDIMENIMKAELDKSIENYEKLRDKFEELKREHEQKLSCTAVENLRLEEEVRKSRVEFEGKIKVYRDMVKELKEERVVVERNLKAELEISRRNYEKELEAELKILVDSHKKELEKETDLMRNKLACTTVEKLRLEEEVRKSRMEFEKKKELEHEREMSENKLIVADSGKMDLVGELSKSRLVFEQRLEALEGKNRNLHKELELYQGSVCTIMDSVKKISYDSPIIGNPRGNGDLSNCSNAGDASMCKPSGKASNGEGRLIKSHTSSKTPSQTERKSSQGELQLGEKRGCSSLENESEDRSCNENNLSCKRIRTGKSKDNNDNLVSKENIGGVLESVKYKMSIANGLRKLDSVDSAPTCIKPRTDENYELHCTKLVSGAVDAIDHCYAHTKADSHVSSENKKAAELRNSTDMISALTHDPELCMAGVVALYRQHIFAGNPSNILTQVDIVSATAVARYLIKNDPTNKINRSLLEVEQDCPYVLQTCQRLAIKYKDQLLEIYENEWDPLFCSKS